MINSVICGTSGSRRSQLMQLAWVLTGSKPEQVSKGPVGRCKDLFSLSNNLLLTHCPKQSSQIAQASMLQP